MGKGPGGPGLSAPASSAWPGPGPPSRTLSLHHATYHLPHHHPEGKCPALLASTCSEGQARLGGPTRGARASSAGEACFPSPRRVLDYGLRWGLGRFWGPGQGDPLRSAGTSIPEVSATLSLQSRSSVQQGDLDGARRLGRLARLLSVTFFIMGVIIIIVAVTVNFAGETQPHGAERASLLGVRTTDGCSPAPWGGGDGMG